MDGRKLTEVKPGKGLIRIKERTKRKVSKKFTFQIVRKWKFGTHLPGNFISDRISHPKGYMVREQSGKIPRRIT